MTITYGRSHVRMFYTKIVIASTPHKLVSCCHDTTTATTITTTIQTTATLQFSGHFPINLHSWLESHARFVAATTCITMEYNMARLRTANGLFCCYVLTWALYRSLRKEESLASLTLCRVMQIAHCATTTGKGMKARKVQVLSHGSKSGI